MSRSNANRLENNSRTQVGFPARHGGYPGKANLHRKSRRAFFPPQSPPASFIARQQPAPGGVGPGPGKARRGSARRAARPGDQRPRATILGTDPFRRRSRRRPPGARAEGAFHPRRGIAPVAQGQRPEGAGQGRTYLHRRSGQRSRRARYASPQRTAGHGADGNHRLAHQQRPGLRHAPVHRHRACPAGGAAPGLRQPGHRAGQGGAGDVRFQPHHHRIRPDPARAQHAGDGRWRAAEHQSRLLAQPGQH